MVEGSRTVLSGIKIRTFLKNAVTVVCCSSVFVKFAISYLRPFLSSFSLLLVLFLFSLPPALFLIPFLLGGPLACHQYSETLPVCHLFPGFSLGTLVHLSLLIAKSYLSGSDFPPYQATRVVKERCVCWYHTCDYNSPESLGENKTFIRTGHVLPLSMSATPLHSNVRISFHFNPCVLLGFLGFFLLM